jgi:citrate lyase beta subunit
MRSCIQGRDLGFDGKSLIHPSQIALTNSHYSPSEADVLHAHKIIQSFLSATASGKSVSVLDNKLVEKVRTSVSIRCARNHVARLLLILLCSNDKKPIPDILFFLLH